MNRLGLMLPSELEGETKDLYDTFDKYITDRFGRNSSLVTRDSQDRLIGPFGVLLHTPPLAPHFTGISNTIAQIPGLKPRSREIAIVTVCARFDVGYELYAHKMIAERQGITKAEIESMLKGERPETFDAEGKAVYDVARELVLGSGPLTQGAWEQVVGVIGKDGATALVHYVAFYSYVSMMSRGFDCKVPDGTS